MDGEAPGASLQFGDYPGQLHALLVLMAHIDVTPGVAYRRFMRKDVTAPTGT